MTADDYLQKRRGQANQGVIRAMAVVHEKKPGQRERTALIAEIRAESSGSVATCNHSKREVRNASLFAASMEPYLWDTPSCKAIIKFLIGGRPPVRFDKVESPSYVYWTDGVQHWAIKPYRSAYGYLRFSLYECTDGGVMAAVEKSHKKAADKHLCAPDLFALLSQGETVPLPAEQRRQWRQELERQAFTKSREAESDREEIPLVVVESPDFMYSLAAKAFGVEYQNDVNEPIAERMLWFCINDGLQRGLQRRRAEKLFRLIQWFYNEWRMGAKNGLPCVVEASDGYIANAIDADAGTVRLLCETLERHGIIAKAHQYDSKKGSAHFGYPLSHFIRCANPECSWSNLSGHQTYDKKTRKDGTTDTATYSYYNHLPRNRKGANCIHSIPAQEIEDEIFSRIGQFLKNSEVLLSAIRSAMIKNPEETERLKREEDELRQLLASENKRLSNALDMLLEHRGTPTATALEAKIGILNNSISSSSERLSEVQNTLKLTVFPQDLEQRVRAAVSRLAGLHGHMPMHWPIEAKRALLRLFIGGDKSTRFDRSGKHVRSDERGIFISKVQPDDEAPYWTYQVKGAVGNFSGAITNVIETYEKYADEEISRQFSNAELHELARMSEDFTGMKDFRVSPPASRRWFG